MVANERFVTTSAGYSTFLAWDEQWVYVGMDGADVGSASPLHFVLVYFGGAAGTTTGQAYGTAGAMTPGLPFEAKWHLRWKADNTLTGMQTWDGMAWVDTTFGGSAFQTGNFLEMRIPRSEIGDPSSLKIHVSMVNEMPAGNFTFAGAPSTSFTDAVDPDYAKYFALDLIGSIQPSAHPPLP